MGNLKVSAVCIIPPAFIHLYFHFTFTKIIHSRQVEAWESYKPSKVKDKAQRAVAMLHADGTLAAEEDMLRLYRILVRW